MEQKKTEVTIDVSDLKLEQVALTPLQHKFVMEYLKDANAAKAMERAGAKGTKNTFKMLGYQMIRLPAVQIAIKEAQGKIIERAGLERQDIVNHLMDTAREARVAKKFDAAVRSYQQVAELHGWLNKTTKKEADDANKKLPVAAAEAFGVNQDSNEAVDVNEDIREFLRLVKPSSSA